MAERARGSRTRVLVVVLGVWSAAGPCPAATCPVPSASHPTIQAAIDDIGCTDIDIAAGTYAEAPAIARTVTLQGAGSTQTSVTGGVVVSAGSVVLTGMHLSAPGTALRSSSGAEVSGFDLEVISGIDSALLFSDGFETGDTGAWSGTAP